MVTLQLYYSFTAGIPTPDILLLFLLFSIPPPPSYSCPLFVSICRSSFLLQLLTIVLQTALTSAQRMTALLSSWKQGLAAQVHAKSTAAIVAAVQAAVAPAAPLRLKQKSLKSLMDLRPTPLHHLSVSPQDVQQRAAAAKCLLPLTRRKIQRMQGCDALVLLLSQVT